MADPRFFPAAGPFTLRQLAEIAEAEPAAGGDPDREYRDVAPLAQAGPGDVSFLDNTRYLDSFAASGAGACVVERRHAERAPAGMALLYSAAPYRAYARIAAAFHPEPALRPGLHPAAQIDATARIGQDVEVGPGAVVGAGAEIGARCRIAANAVIGPGVVLGEGCDIGASAVLTHCLLGARVRIHPGACIGQRGFGFDMSAYPYADVPQLGRVVIEDDVEVGANTTIDRGAGPDTVIGAGSKLDNLVQIGHNVRLGRGCVLVAQSGVAGSTVLGDHVVLAAQSGLAGHLHIGDGAQVGATAGVMRDIPAGQKVAGTPAMPVKEFFRLVAIWQRLLKTKGKSNE